MQTLVRTCLIFDCDQETRTIGLCKKHYGRLLKNDTTDLLRPRGRQKAESQICGIEGCEKSLVARQMCKMHYRRWYLYKDPHFKKVWGNKSPSHYRSLTRPDHPNANSDGNIFEHRLVMSEMLGRPLVEGENVHHKNGNRKDNRPENLELWNTKQPAGQRPEDKVIYAIEILTLYAPDLLAGKLGTGEK